MSARFVSKFKITPTINNGIRALLKKDHREIHKRFVENPADIPILYKDTTRVESGCCADLGSNCFSPPAHPFLQTVIKVQ